MNMNTSVNTSTLLETYQRLSDGIDFNERDRLILSFRIYDIPQAIQDDILDAYDHYLDNPTEFDGSTGAKENWVSKYEPASMRHDLDYQTYGGTFKGRLYADLKFLDYKKRYQVSAIWRYIQYFAVRWGGYFFQFTNWLKSNTEKVPMEKQFLAPSKRPTSLLVIEWLGIVTLLPITFFVLGAMVMTIKHKISIGWKLSTKWLKGCFKKLFSKF